MAYGGQIMKAVILAGGRGTRIAEESHLRPKPMVTIGDMPILWHIMKIYDFYGIRDFVICLGYRGYVVKEYFANYCLHRSTAVTFDLSQVGQASFGAGAEPWRVTLVETGLETQTGGRIKRILPWVKDDEAFCLTYGDGLADVDIAASMRFHRQHGGWATVTTVMPPGRFGVISTEGSRVTRFAEKPTSGEAVINGGFFVLSPRVIDLIDDDASVWEREPVERLAALGQLYAFEHRGFWQPMDTLREREELEKLWSSGKAPWKRWD
jgi:glucose-1-phosphate cytidylyltransferase